jgi:hypothetical protein
MEGPVQGALGIASGGFGSLQSGGQPGKESKTVNSCFALLRKRRRSNSDNIATRNLPDGASTLPSARFPQKKVLEDELAVACRKLRTAGLAM